MPLYSYYICKINAFDELNFNPTIVTYLLRESQYQRILLISQILDTYEVCAVSQVNEIYALRVIS